MNLYKLLIKFYPEDFQAQHGEELLQAFDDLKRDRGIFATWFFVLPDFLGSVVKINAQYLMQQSSVQFKLAIAGLILVSPFVLLVGASVFGTLLGLDTNSYIGQHFIAGHFRLFTALLVFLPAAAFLMNIVPLLNNISQEPRMSNALSLTFIRANFVTLAAAAIGIGAVVLLLGHDAVPCFVNGLINQHFHNIIPLLNKCKNA